MQHGVSDVLIAGGADYMDMRSPFDRSKPISLLTSICSSYNASPNDVDWAWSKPGVPLTINTIGKGFFTPLFASLEAKNLTLADYLVDEKGASLEVVEVGWPPFDRTIMHCCCYALANVGSIRWLIGRGLSLHELDADGRSPLDIAETMYKKLGLEGQVRSNHQESIEFLRSESSKSKVKHRQQKAEDDEKVGEVEEDVDKKPSAQPSPQDYPQEEKMWRVRCGVLLFSQISEKGLYVT